VLGCTYFKDKVSAITDRPVSPGKPGRPGVEEGEASYCLAY